MALYEITPDSLAAVKDLTFAAAGVYERRDLQRLLCQNLEALVPDSLVISEEFGEWEESRRRIDILAVDRDANLVVVELKRNDTGAHMELQALRYAAMVSTMTFDQVVRARASYLASQGLPSSACEEEMLTFLGWQDSAEADFPTDVRIVLAAAEFSRELVTSVLWLNERELDVRCFRMRPYELSGRVLIDVQQVIPLPEAEDYQIKIRERAERKREKLHGGPDFTRFDLLLDGETHTGLWKRRMALMLVRHVIDRYDAKPDELRTI